MRSFTKNTKIKILIVILFYISLICSMFLLSTTVMGIQEVISGSMKNTLLISDKYIQIKLINYFPSLIQRGDIINFKHSDDIVVKRVIGLPGETVEIKEGIVFINDKPVEENYTIKSNDDFEKITIPENNYFVLGDNRLESFDSRFWEYPFVNEEDILGKAIISFNSKKIKKLS